MADSHMVSGLKQFRVEHLRVLDELRAQLHEIETKIAAEEELIAHVDGVLKVAAPDLNLETVKPTRARRALAGPKTARANAVALSDGKIPVTQFVLRTLRENGASTAAEIVGRAAAFYPERTEEQLESSIRQFLSAKVRENLLVTTKEDGPKRYEIRR